MSESSTDRVEIEKQLIDIFIADGMVERSAITPNATLESLGVQSVDVMMILMSIEEKFGFYIPIDSKVTESTNLNELVNVFVDRIVEERKSSAK